MWKADFSARGKTHISRALERYLRWLGVKTRVYSLGDYRRKTIGGAENLPPDYFQTKCKQFQHRFCRGYRKERDSGTVDAGVAAMSGS